MVLRDNGIERLPTPHAELRCRPTGLDDGFPRRSYPDQDPDPARSACSLAAEDASIRAVNPFIRGRVRLD